MNSSKSAKYSQGEAKTRAPIHYEWNLTNWIYSSSHDPQAFLKFLQSLEENPPEVMAGSIFAGVVPFDWGIRGAIMGQADPILGGALVRIPI